MRTVFPNESLNPLDHMRPYIRISPFSAGAWENSLKSVSAGHRKKILDPSFWLNEAVDLKFYASGRLALLACLKSEGLKQNDEVLIVTTTNGPYISSCVTKTIEQICRWSRRKTDRTRMLLVIHEFGFPCPTHRVRSLRLKNIPILEDCAYALGSRLNKANIGRYGDYALYSLPKYLPVPYGGLLLAKSKIRTPSSPQPLTGNNRRWLEISLGTMLHQHRVWDRKRRANWEYFREKLKRFRILPYLRLANDVSPGVFWARVPDDFNGAKTKETLVTSGVEATEYYRQRGFYVPVHQYLTDYERDYILRHFL